MHKNKETKALEVAHDAGQLFALEPRIKDLAEITVEVIDNIDSSNMTARHWEKLVDAIAVHYKKYDGFVITMGTNTMAYCSSALSFALPNIGKPVVLTGAQIPAESVTTDARNNLVNAIRVATMNRAGVLVVFGSKIILGCRAKKMSESDLDAFKSFNQKEFGEIGVGIIWNFPGHERRDNLLEVKNGFEDNILCFTMIPGLSGDYLKKLVDDGLKGIILRAYGSGDVPYDLLPSLAYARDKKVPVIVTTQCPGGATVLGINDVGRKALEVGVTQAFDMSMESMSTKLMWLLKHKVSYEKIKESMEKNLVGELDSSRAQFILSAELAGV